MARVSDEKKAWNSFRQAVVGFDWNPGSFAANIVWENAVVQDRIFRTLESVIEALAKCYIQGAFDHRNAEVCEKAYRMHQAIQTEDY